MNVRHIGTGIVLFMLLSSAIVVGVKGGDVSTLTDEGSQIEVDVFAPHINYTFFNQTWNGATSVNVSKIDNMIDVNGTAEYTFDVMVYHAQGIMSNISYVDIVAWYDEGNDTTYYDYDVHNASHPGSNLNMHLRYNVTYHIFYMLYGNESGECWLLPKSHSNLLDPNHLQLKFVIRPYYQIRWAPGEGSWTPGPGFNDAKSWNFNVTAYDPVGNPSQEDQRNEYGVYKYLRISASGNPSGSGRPGETIKLTSSTVNYSANCPYRLSVNITNLTSGTDKIPADNVIISAGNLDHINLDWPNRKYYIYGRVGEVVIDAAVETSSTSIPTQRKIVRSSNDTIYAVYTKSVGGRIQLYIAYSYDNGETWSRQAITAGTPSKHSPALAIDSNDVIHVVWTNETGPSTTIWYSNSSDGGKTWSIPIRISENTATDADNPVIAIDSGDKVVVVYDYGGRIYWNYSVNGVWQTESPVSQPANCKKPTIAFGKNNRLFVVWENYTGTYTQLFYTNSSSTWPTYGSQITTSPGNKTNASVVVDSYNKGHVVYERVNTTTKQRDIYYLNESSRPLRLTGGGNASSPQLAIDTNNRLYLAYTDENGNLNIRRKIGDRWRQPVLWREGIVRNASFRWSFYNSPLTGWSATMDVIYIYNATLTNQQLMYNHISLSSNMSDKNNTMVSYVDSASSTAYNGQRCVVRDGQGDVYVAYVKDYGGADHVYVAKSSDNGRTWTDMNGGVPISGESGWETYTAIEPALAVDDIDRLHLVWIQYDGTIFRVYYNVYTPTLGWSMRAQISGPYLVYNCTIVVDKNNNPHVIWSEEDAANVRQIYYREYTGSGWGPIQQLSGLPNTDSLSPAAAMDNAGRVHVVWEKMDTIGFQQVFYNYGFGAAWAGQLQVTYGTTNKRHPSVAVNTNNQVNVVYENYTNLGRSTVYHLIIGSGSPPAAVSNFSLNALSPSIAINADNQVFVAYTYNTTSASWIVVRGAGKGYWEPEINITTNRSNWFSRQPVLRWSRFHHHIDPNDRNIWLDCVWTEEDALSHLYTVNHSALNVGIERVLEKRQPPLDNGFYSNGTKENEVLTVQWWIKIPYGTPEGHYTAPITYTLKS